MTDEELAKIQAAGRAAGRARWGTPIPARAIQVLRLAAQDSQRADDTAVTAA